MKVYQASENLDNETKEKVETELNLGFLNLSEGLFEQAHINFLLALQYDSKCAEAYWGLVLYKFQIKNEVELHKNPMTFKSVVMLPEYENAMQYASENQKKRYEDLLDRIYAINEGDNY